MMKMRRTVRVHDDGTEAVVDMKDLEPGMKFRLFEEDGTAVVSEGETVFTAADKPFESGGVWGVRCESESYMRGVVDRYNPESQLLLTDAAVWAGWVAKNDDPYGACIFRYAEKWGVLMQKKMVELPHKTPAEVVQEFADKLSHEADNEGITGFMYGAAVSCLAKCWVHGEALRRWHNKETQLKDEGDKANEEGGVLNPAVLVLGSKGE